MAWLTNFGELPAECVIRDENGKPTGRYRRVVVKLRNGTVHGQEPNGSQGQRGWDAQTTRWSLTSHSHDVMEFELA